MSKSNTFIIVQKRKKYSGDHQQKTKKKGKRNFQKIKKKKLLGGFSFCSVDVNPRGQQPQCPTVTSFALAALAPSVPEGQACSWFCSAPPHVSWATQQTAVSCRPPPLPSPDDISLEKGAPGHPLKSTSHMFTRNAPFLWSTMLFSLSLFFSHSISQTHHTYSSKRK